jgi:OOP family OmpA-OmpF porin
MKWLLPILAVLAAIWAFRNCSDDVADAASDVKDAAGAATDVAANAVGDVAGDAVSAVGNGIGVLGDFFKRTLPNRIELNIPEHGIEANLLDFISDGAVDEITWFNFDRINFATGRANLTAESTEQVKDITEILTAYPNVKLKIGGYTDNTGSADGNMKLSQNKANTVMGTLVANGIGAGRLSAGGFGSAHPMASNDTEEGKGQNRRIAVRVTEK